MRPPTAHRKTLLRDNLEVKHACSLRTHVGAPPRRPRHPIPAQADPDVCEPQLKRLISGANGTAEEVRGNQLRPPSLESPHRASDLALRAAAEVRAAQPRSPGGRGAADDDLDAGRREGSVSSGDESPDLLEGLSDTSSSDGDAADPLDGWMERDRRFAEMEREVGPSRERPASRGPGAHPDDMMTSSEPNFAPSRMGASQLLEQQPARQRSQQSDGDSESGRLPELLQAARGSADAPSAGPGGSSLERLHATPSASVASDAGSTKCAATTRALPCAAATHTHSDRTGRARAWMTASTPLFEKLKEISILSEAVDEEEVRTPNPKEGSWKSS